MQKVEDTGKLSDMVRLTLTIADREGRTHRYGYRRAMRYSVDERPEGDVFIHFWADPEDRVHEAVRTTDDLTLIATIMRTILSHDPKLLTGDAGASGEACGAMACVMGMLMASIYHKRPEAYPHVRDKVIAKIDVEAAKTLDTVRGMMEEAVGEQAQRTRPDAAS